MPYETYKLIHVTGLFLLFLGFGGMLFGARAENGRPPKPAVMLHGIGLLLMLVAGFGLMARLSYDFPWPGWIFVKIGLWLALGAFPVIIRRAKLGTLPAFVVLILLAGTAAWLAIQKPF